MHMLSRSRRDCGEAFTYHFTTDAARRTSDRKRILFIGNTSLMSAPAKPKKLRRKLCELFLIICWVITLAHTSISPPLVSTLLLSTQRKLNYMALPEDDNVIDGRLGFDSTRLDSSRRDDRRNVLENATHGFTSRPLRPSQEFTSFLNSNQDVGRVKWQTKPHTRTH